MTAMASPGGLARRVFSQEGSQALHGQHPGVQLGQGVPPKLVEMNQRVYWKASGVLLAASGAAQSRLMHWLRMVPLTRRQPVVQAVVCSAAAVGRGVPAGQAGVGGDLAEPAGHLLGPVGGVGQDERGVGAQVRAA